MIYDNTPYLSYSGRQSFIECPKKYKFRYILKTKVDRDPRTSLFGSIIGKLFEWFYVDKVWAAPNPSFVLLSRAEEAINIVLKQEKWEEHLDPLLMSRIRSDLHELIPVTVEGIRTKGLVTLNSQAEVDLTLPYYHKGYDMTVKLGGRADFIHTNDNKNVWILDGKASKWKDKYTDPEQLIWYAVQYYLKFGTAPSRLGFFYYRFPKESLKWIEYGENDIRASLTKTFEVSKKIKLKMFDATPSEDSCKFCDYKLICEEGIELTAQLMRESGKTVTDTYFDLEQA